MNFPLLLTLLVAAALTVPTRAAAAGAITQAQTANFDGARARDEKDLVTAGSAVDQRTAAEIARDEQARADTRAALAARTTGPDKEIASKPNEWLKSERITPGVKGALAGMPIGSLGGGLTGLAIGALTGGLIGYAVSRLTA